MKTFTYWVAPYLDGRTACYHLRAKTRKALIAEMNDEHHDPAYFGRPRKVTARYTDVLDLINNIACRNPTEDDN